MHITVVMGKPCYMATDRKSNWAEIATVALNAAQLQKLSALQTAFARCCELEESRHEAQRTSHELRNLLFNFETVLDSIEPLIQQYPSGSLLLLWVVEKDSSKALTANAFAEWTDKDRLHRFQNRLASVIQKARASTSDDGAEAVECRRYLEEAPTLNVLSTEVSAILAARSREAAARQEIHELTADLARLNNQIQRQDVRGIKAVVAGMLLSIAAGWLLGIAAGLLTGIVTALVVLIVSTIIILLHDHATRPDQSGTKQKENRILILQASLRLAETDIAQRYGTRLAQFGVDTAEQLEAVDSERRRRIAAIMPVQTKHYGEWVEMFAKR